MARASIRIEGLRDAMQRIDEVGERARRPEPALRAPETKFDLQLSERRRFSHARGWKRITPEWAAEKRRRGLDPRVMRATGRLESVLTNADAGDIRFDAYNAVLRWGLKWRSTAYYAAAQAKRGRRAVVIDRQARAAITERVQRYIAGEWS
ncbi:hypothetical protein [Miltoncostaea marina]|uniref:hypothetical protein n=1 Tax=Miltoncostaea marina TaxID=2843215 RepID=UPI001C3E7D51|nr:hypothetical protein [Miltoncostaea marina]